MKFHKLEKINLIYIVGNGRSGSTLLTRILNNHDSLASLGELQYFDIRREKNSENKLFKSIAKRYLKELKLNKRSLKNVNKIKVCRYPSLREFLNFYNLSKPNNIKTSLDKLNFYKDNYLFFKSILKLTKKSFIVDCSKTVSRLYNLHESGLFNIKIIYLHRCSRAFINSGIKKGLNVFQSSFHWKIRNKRAQMFIKQTQLPYYELKYENLIRYPEKTLSKLFKNLLYMKFNRNIINFSEKEDVIGGNPDLKGKIFINKKQNLENPISFFHVLVDRVINSKMNKSLGYK